MDKGELGRILRERILRGARMSAIEVVGPQSKKHKCGVYMALRNDGTVAYVGMVSNAKTASLYMRFHGNGNSAHDKAGWWKDVGEVRFERFEVEKESLRLIERLVILASQQPDHNDVCSDRIAVNRLVSELKILDNLEIRGWN